MDVAPNSRLTLMRPDIWQRGLALASRMTDYAYAPKVPLPNGAIYACGGWNPYGPPVPPKPKTKDEIRREEIERIDREIGYIDQKISDIDSDVKDLEQQKTELKIQRRELEKQKKKLVSAPRVFVPEGAMEWLLHEAGHWVAASVEERALPNYGYDLLFAGDSAYGDAREWQAWAFEEIILAPYGPARHFGDPSWRDGVGFSKSGPIPQAALAHIDRRMREERIEAAEWRAVWGDWISWGASLGADAPWL